MDVQRWVINTDRLGKAYPFGHDVLESNRHLFGKNLCIEFCGKKS
jgi:hypothetical protein